MARSYGPCPIPGCTRERTEGAATCGREGHGQILRKQNMARKKAEDMAAARKVSVPVVTAPPPPPAPPVFRTVESSAPGRYERVLFWPDTHAGDADERSVSLALKVCRAWRPHRVIILGDFIDCLGFSRFEFNPGTPAARIQHELDIAHALLPLIADASPGAVRQFIRGNHEARLEKFLWKNPSLLGLAALDLSRLLRLEEFGFDPAIYETILLAEGSFHVTHGTAIRADAGQSAKVELLRRMCSGASGHTHREGQFFYRSEIGLLNWTECGCLQSNPPSWRPYTQNWQHGVAKGEFEVGGNAFDVQPVPFRLSGKCHLDGVELAA